MNKPLLEYISPSRLSAFERCQHFFKAKYIDGVVYEEEKTIFDVGHAFEEKLLTDKTEVKLSKTYTARIESMLERIKVFGIEVKNGEFQKEMTGKYRGYNLLGYADFVGIINGERAIIDIKTTGNISSWTPFRADNEIQPPFYSLCYEQMQSKADLFSEVERLPFYFLVVSTDPFPKVRTFKLLPSPDRTAKLLERIDKLIDTVESGLYFTAECDCENSLYWKECPNSKNKSLPFVL